MNRSIARPLNGLLRWRILGSAAAVAFVCFASSRARRRAGEAERRRREMELLQEFSARLLRARTVPEAATIGVEALAELFSASRAVLRADSAEYVHPPGALPAAGLPEHVIHLPLDHLQIEASLECCAFPPSREVRNALANLLGLVIDRARNLEEHARAEAVRKSSELRTTILNAVAHDFRTPLTSIKAAASALRVSSASIFEADRELIAVINEEALRLESLISESLALARLETLDEVPAEVCPVPAIVAGVLNRLSPNLDRRRVRLDLPDDLPPLAGDRFLLELMVLQVLENAWKYSQPGARILVSGRAQGERIAVSIWNEGLRIPDYEKDRIFDKFYRGAGRHGRTEGSGLGLAIAKSIAEAHRGSIWLDDASDGVCFRFLLPAAQGEHHVSQLHDPAD